MSKLHRILSGEENKTLGLVKNPSGIYVASLQEAAEFLMDKHFPGSTSYHGGRAPETAPRELSETLGWITGKKIKAAFAGFGSHKSPGPDGLKPIVLQHLPDAAIARVSSLYKACLTVGYTPYKWRQSKVIFIPKPGKTDYSLVSSFRPISLTSFLFKGLERMIQWHLEDTLLRSTPLHQHQHAFHKGFSTESALTDVVDDIERAITHQQYALGVSLDISGAFDNLSPGAIVSSLRRRGLTELICSWYENYLLNRYARFSLKGAI